MGTLLFASAALAALHLPVVAWLPSKLAFSPLRISVYMYLALILMASAGCARLIGRGGARRFAGALLALLFVTPFADLAYSTAWRRVPPLRRALDRSHAARPALFHPDLALRGRESEVREFCAALRRIVPKDARILAPPRGASPLRLHARRSLYVAGEDSVVALYDRRCLELFRTRLRRAVEAYASDDARPILALAREEGCEYVILTAKHACDAAPLAEGAGMRLVQP